MVSYHSAAAITLYTRIGFQADAIRKLFAHWFKRYVGGLFPIALKSAILATTIATVSTTPLKWKAKPFVTKSHLKRVTPRRYREKIDR